MPGGCSCEATGAGKGGTGRRRRARGARPAVRSARPPEGPRWAMILRRHDPRRGPRWTMALRRHGPHGRTSAKAAWAAKRPRRGGAVAPSRVAPECAGPPQGRGAGWRLVALSARSFRGPSCEDRRWRPGRLRGGCSCEATFPSAGGRGCEPLHVDIARKRRATTSRGELAPRSRKSGEALEPKRQRKRFAQK